MRLLWAIVVATASASTVPSTWFVRDYSQAIDECCTSNHTTAIDPSSLMLHDDVQCKGTEQIHALLWMNNFLSRVGTHTYSDWGASSHVTTFLKHYRPPSSCAFTHRECGGIQLPSTADIGIAYLNKSLSHHMDCVVDKVLTSMKLPWIEHASFECDTVRMGMVQIALQLLYTAWDVKSTGPRLSELEQEIETYITKTDTHFLDGHVCVTRLHTCVEYVIQRVLMMSEYLSRPVASDELHTLITFGRHIHDVILPHMTDQTQYRNELHLMAVIVEFVLLPTFAPVAPQEHKDAVETMTHVARLIRRLNWRHDDCTTAVTALMAKSAIYHHIYRHKYANSWPFEGKNYK